VDGLERDLVLAAKSGDRSAFKTLAETYYPRLFRMLLSMTRDEDVAMDLTQDTFVKAIQAIEGFQMSSSFYTWLFRIGRNTALDRFRRNKTAGIHHEYKDQLAHGGEGTVDFPVSPSYSGDPLKQVVSREALGKVRQALDELKPDHREIILLREVEELTYEEIAEVVGIKVGTVMSRLFAARRNLREVLRERHGMSA